MNAYEYLKNTAVRKSEPVMYNRVNYTKLYKVCRERFNYSPVDIANICRVAEQLKDAGYTEEDVRDTEHLILTESFLNHHYIGTNSRDKRIYQAIGRYKNCLEVMVG